MRKRPVEDPDFVCWLDDHVTEDEGRGLKASRVFDEEGAAIRFAQDLCSDDTDFYSYFEGSGPVCVRNKKTGKLYTVPVEVRAEPTFHVGRKKEIDG